jgi:hypothetical protein
MKNNNKQMAKQKKRVANNHSHKKEQKMINKLTDIYERWTTVNELPVLSADEHDRDKLTEEQIKWLNEFSEHWDNQIDIDHFIDDNTPKFFELPKNTIIKFGEYEHNICNGFFDFSNEKGKIISKDDTEMRVQLEKYFPLLKDWDNCLVFMKCEEENYNDLQFGVIKKGTYGT